MTVKILDYSRSEAEEEDDDVNSSFSNLNFHLLTLNPVWVQWISTCSHWLGLVYDPQTSCWVGSVARPWAFIEANYHFIRRHILSSLEKLIH